MSTPKDTTPKPNYRIYDRTGGGGTEDIHAENLDAAIAAGRDWIENGDWSSDREDTYKTIKLECCVREIVYTPDLSSLEALPGVVAVELCEPVSAYPETRVRVTLAEESAKATLPGTIVDASTVTDGEFEVVLAVPSLPMVIDEEATNDNDSYDCSGEYSDVQPVCELAADGEHDWHSPFALVGGISSNPGVWSNGGTCMTFKFVCAHCGQFRTTVDKGSQVNPNEPLKETTFEAATKESLAWVMTNMDLPDEVEIRGVKVALEWDKNADVTDEDAALGVAIHVVSNEALMSSTAGGPKDDDTFTVGTSKFVLPLHAESAAENGLVTFGSIIYRVL